MRVVVIGLGIQGKKRRAIAEKDVVATVDPVSVEADYRSIYDVDLELFDAALCCIPDKPKFEILSYLIKNKKHVLVEKPLWVEKDEQITQLQEFARENMVQCYTAYNHRFEPHFQSMKEILASRELGEIYRCRLFYGNGTARLVRESEWRDKGAGVLPDLASHLLDTILFWFENFENEFSVQSASRFENTSPDHVIISCEGSRPSFELEMTLLQWKNHFTCDIFAEKGSAHIESLCKWGPATIIQRKRIFPSGKPLEERTTLAQPDPTWELEYKWFKDLCASEQPADLTKDLWLSRNINRLSENVLGVS